MFLLRIKDDAPYDRKKVTLLDPWGAYSSLAAPIQEKEIWGTGSYISLEFSSLSYGERLCLLLSRVKGPLYDFELT